MTRGDIVVMAARGAYTSKPRPAVVVQANQFNPTHPSVTVRPITPECADAPLFRVTLPPGNCTGLTARGESLAAFDGRCIPAGCVAPRSNTPGILGRRALPAGRLARLGATPDFHHGLLSAVSQVMVDKVVSIPRAAIVRQIGFCDPTYVDAIDEALRVWLAL